MTSTNVIETTIRQFGQQRNVKGLQDYVLTLPAEEIIEMVETKINSLNFAHILNYLMQSFVNTQESHTKRLKVIMALLKKLETNNGRSSQNNTIVSRLCIELSKLKTEHLVEISNFCIELIQKGGVTQMSWKDLLPEVINVLVEREIVEHNGIEITGLEYKTQIINSLCVMQWSANIITTLAAMFGEMPLSKEEHLEVVNKFLQGMDKLTPQEIPAFTYQLLKLCKHQHGRGVFLRLQTYFNTRMYNNLNEMESESNSEKSSLDIIENTEDHNVRQAESTVLYHIYQSAFLGHESIKEYVSSMRNITKCPEFILHPFQLSVLLSISNVPNCEEKAFELIRMSISREFNEEEKMFESCWIRDNIHNYVKIETTFSKVIDASIEERDLVVQGLVNLAYVLLGVGSALGRDPIAEKQWKLGQLILLKIIKRKRQIAPDVIQRITNHIFTGQSVNQYTDVVYLLSKNMALLMIENVSSTVSLMEALVQVPGQVASDLLDAVIPLAKLSHTIRDQLILLLRKALYSRVIETRQVAVIGFLKLLKSLKISNLAALSQSSSSSESFSSGRSLFTQISLNQSSQTDSTSNEALCLEVLRILKRCFMQQVEVRGQFYKELYDAICINPELGIPVLDAIWIHFDNYYVPDESSLPPLHFSKIYTIRELEVVLHEPMGKLIYAIGLIVIKVKETDSENPTIKKFTSVMDSLVSRMINCELIHFELDDGTDLSDNIPESQQKVVVLKEVLLTYEALIGYKISMWDLESENCAQQINNLFQGYMRLIHFSKNINKPKKAEGKNKKNDGNKSTQQTNNTTIKKDSLQKAVFKLPATLLNFKTIVKILSLLHRTEVPWSSAAQANIIKPKVEFHRYILQATIEIVQSYKNARILDKQEAKQLYEFYKEIALILYNRCIERISEFVDFDSETANLAADCFRNILQVIKGQFRDNFNQFICAVAKGDKSDDILSNLPPLIETYKKIIDTEDEEASDDDKKLSVTAVNTLSILTSYIPAKGGALSLQLLDWLKEYANMKNPTNKQTASGLIALLFSMYLKFKSGLQLFNTVAVKLGDIMGTINEEEASCEELKLINEALATSTFQNVCSCIKSALEDVTWLINRLKAEYCLVIYLSSECSERKKEDLKNKEKSISCQLCFLISILTALSNITIQLGPVSENLLKNLILLYNTLNSFTKYFISRSSKYNVAFQDARLERLVKFAGKQLSPVVYKLILYLEECQKQATESTQGKKKNVDSNVLKNRVLRETKMIPKVIFEIEQFSKSVVQLGKKTNVDLAHYVGQGTARDFRILNLKEVLKHNQRQNDSELTSQDTTDVTENEEMEVDESEDVENTSVTSDNDEDDSPQPAKRTKK